ncbi:MAG: transcription antitermination protein [bacterium]|nr:MAG: transcription antitermination protein [bacterium]
MATMNSTYPTDLKEWYAVYTRSRHEEKVYTRLKNKDFEVFLPKAETWSRRKDRRKKIWMPLFPGYIFVQSQLDNYSYHDILKTVGVVRIIGIKGHPTPIPEEEIVSLKLMVNSGQPVFPHNYIKTGDKVTVIDGPLEGAVGTILRAKSKKDKLVVSIPLLQRSIAVEVHEWAVKKISS